MTRTLATLVAAAGALGMAGCDLMLEINLGNLNTTTTTTGQGGTGGSSNCVPGEQRACYSGPEGTEGHGICRAGIQTCDMLGTGFGACEGEQLPGAENCATPQDEDCDGLAPACDAQCIWSKAFGDEKDQEGTAIAFDLAGNVVTTGAFAGTIDFGTGLLTAAGASMFVARHDTEGTPIWADSFGSTTSISTPAVAIGADGHAVNLVTFQGQLSWGATEVSSAGGFDFVLASLDGSGTPLWAKSFGDSGYQAAQAIAADALGDIVIAGEFSGSVDFGSGPEVSAGGIDALVAAFDSSGVALWSKRFGDSDTQVARAIDLTHTGEIVLGGAFKGSIDLGVGALVSKGDFDVLVGKLDAGGATLWATSFGDAQKQMLHDLAVDTAGDVIVTGSFSGTMDVGGTVLSAGSEVNIFALKLSGVDGAPLWAKNFGDTGDITPTRVATTPTGDVVLTGAFTGTVDFGGGALGGFGEDVFAVKLRGDGTHVWSRRYGDPDNQSNRQWGLGIVGDDAGNLYLTGFFEGQIDFGCGILKSKGGHDGFLAKIAP